MKMEVRDCSHTELRNVAGEKRVAVDAPDCADIEVVADSIAQMNACMNGTEGHETVRSINAASVVI